jgi:hypothetical protein
VYAAVNVSVPVASDPAGTVMLALPLANVVDAEAYVPLVSFTEPVGVPKPLPPATVMVTVVVCALVMLAGDGDTVTAGVTLAVTVTVPVPVAVL